MLKNIKSKKVLFLIFEKLNTRIKLKTIKYNKEILNRLNINTADFEDFKKLKEFNQKYNLKIKDIDISILDLSGKRFGNEVIEEIINLRFKELKELNLRVNNISDIKALVKVKFKKLEILDLSENEISDINILDKVNFKELKELYLR